MFIFGIRLYAQASEYFPLKIWPNLTPPPLTKSLYLFSSSGEIFQQSHYENSMCLSSFPATAFSHYFLRSISLLLFKCLCAKPLKYVATAVSVVTGKNMSAKTFDSICCLRKQHFLRVYALCG